MQPKTIGVIGVGPVGGILSAHLHSSGHNVVLVDAWKEHVDHIRTQGLRITGREDLLVKPAHLLTSVETLNAFKPEFVFICTKACDLDALLHQMSDALKGSKAVFISAQNGIDTEKIIAAHIEPARVLRAAISYAGVLEGPGEIRETFFNPPNYIGWLAAGGEASCRQAAAVMSECGLTTEATEEIQRFVWRKTILNTCTMAVAAVTGLNMEEMMDFAPTAQLVDRLLKESIAVAAAYGFDYGPRFFDSVMEFNARAGPHRPSMMVDIEKGRRTENSVLIRRVAEYGEAKGVPAPVHRTLANLIDALEMRNLRRRH